MYIFIGWIRKLKYNVLSYGENAYLYSQAELDCWCFAIKLSNRITNIRSIVKNINNSKGLLMNQNIVRLIIEKVIATVLIIVGSYILYKIITGLHHTIEHVHSVGTEISVYKIFKNYHFQLIVSVLTIVSGIFIILGKRIGWIGCVTMTFVFGIAGLVFLLKSYFRKTIYYEATILELLLFILSLIVFFSLGLLLLKKDFRHKYRPTNKTWIIIILVIIILSIDRILIN